MGFHKRSFVKAAKSAKGGLLLGYARVSKGDEQTNTLQAKALRAAGCRRIFEEAASGGRWDRPELHRMLDQLREGTLSSGSSIVWVAEGVLHIMERSRRPARVPLDHREHRHTTRRTHDEWSPLPN